MKIGDVVTYKQRADLAEHPTPWHRLGTIVSKNGNANAVPCLPGTDIPRVVFEVYWWGSKNTVSHEEPGLDYPSLEAR